MLEETMLGKYQHTVDAKNRIAIPARLRETLGDTFIIFKSLRDKCIRVVSGAEWERFIQPYRQLPRELGDNIIQMLTDDAATVTPDSQGRVVIPQNLLDQTGILKNVEVIGRDTYLEIWSAEVYQEKTAKRDRDALLAEAAKYGL